MATAHTYYLPFREPRAGEKAHGRPVLGERAGDEAVAEVLRRIWRADGVQEPTPFDGVSAWLDEAGAVHVRIIRANGVEEYAPTPEDAEALNRLLKAQESTDNGG